VAKRSYSSSITHDRKRGWCARIQYYDSEGRRKGICRSADSKPEAKLLLDRLIEKYGLNSQAGSSLLDSRHKTFKWLCEQQKKERYFPATYSTSGKRTSGVRNPKKIHSAIDRLASLLGEIRLSELSVQDLRNYRRARLAMKSRQGTNIEPATVNREMSLCRTMLNHAVTNDWILVNPFQKAMAGELIPISDENQREIILSVAEEKKLLAACHDRYFKAFVVAGIDTGARAGELLSLTWQYVDFTQDTIKVFSFKGKNRTERYVPMTPRLKEHLLGLERGIGDTLVFKRVTFDKKEWNRVREEAGLTHLHFHDLRHP